MDSTPETNSEESILYELLVYSEWAQEQEVLVRGIPSRSTLFNRFVKEFRIDLWRQGIAFFSLWMFALKMFP